jgi:uncharacterized membrane protein YoaK (UPF0700 family)
MTTRGTRRIVLLFTFAAGCVDAIAYLTAHVFTANMTGNAVLMAISVGQGKTRAILYSLVALILFVAGVVLGAILAGEGGDEAKTLSAVRGEVIVETAILAVFATVFLLPRETATITLLVTGSSALAMGLQSAAVKRLRLPGIATTYITGTITNLFFGLTQHWRQGRTTHDVSSPTLKRFLVLQAQVFLCYALAALVCGALYIRWPSVVAWLPAIATATVAVLMSARSVL